MNQLNAKSPVGVPVSTAVLALYKRPLPSSRSGALYNAFSYPTKISPEAIALYIAIHTKPGATVMDTFGGSGTTGLAAKLCDKPTPEMVASAVELGLSPEWGPRHAILYELGCIGSYIATVMCNPPDPELFVTEAAELVGAAYKKLRPLLTVIDDDGAEGVLRHAIWSEVLVCPHCQHEHTFWEASIEESPLRLRKAATLYECPGCGKSISTGSAGRAVETVQDPLLAGSKSTVTVRNQSSTSLVEASESIDYVFTDPPFADFIPYSEINQVNELWLGRKTDTTTEAIISPTQGKALEQYAALMSQVFAEISRVLKPAGLTTVVFHAAKATVWKALQESYRSAGLEVVAANVLDKLQASFKQVVSTVSVKGDPLLLLTKGSAQISKPEGDEAVLFDIIELARTLPPAEREPERVYSRYVSRCLETGTRVELNAGDVYARVREAVLQ